MTDFDDFLKKKSDGLQAERQAKLEQDAKNRKDALALESLVETEWPQILSTLRNETDGRIFDSKRFIPINHSGIGLGHIFLIFSNRFSPGGRSYIAEYKTHDRSGSSRFRELRKIILTPKLSGQELLWSSHDLHLSKPVTTTELAKVLAIKLVEIYQENPE